jgi:hypothetical protein
MATGDRFWAFGLMSGATFDYEQLGLRIRSEIDLHLPVASFEAADIELRWGRDLDDSESWPDGPIVAVGGVDNEWWYVAVEADGGHILRFNRCGEFVFSPGLDCIEIRRSPCAERAHLVPVLASGTVLAVLLMLRGSTVLHASAVAVNGEALVFTGPSGRGKSTIAALMCQAGAALVTDDVLAIQVDGTPSCIGGAVELRLRQNAASLAADATRARTTADDRTAFSPSETFGEALPLSAIVIPAPSLDVTEASITRVPPDAALFGLLAVPRVYGWRRERELKRDFSVLSRLVESVPLYVATIPWGPPFQPVVTELLFELMRAEPRGEQV